MRLPAVLVTIGCAAALAGCPDDPPVLPDGGADADTFHDPLSRPVEATLDLRDFGGASSCRPCHRTHHDQWKTSMHSYAMIDPVYRALVAVRQADFDGAQDQFCTQCHSAIGTRGGDIVPGFSFDDLADITLEGVTCEACHRVSELARPHDSGHVIDPSGPMRGPIADPVDPGVHDVEYSPLHDSSEFCGGCHDIHEVSGLSLERPYAEWTTSPAAAAGRNCQSCHMKTYTGQAAPDAPERTLHEHWFVGVDVPLSDGFVTEEEMAGIRGRVRELLDTAAGLRLEPLAEVRAGDQLDVVVTVENRIDGHNLPTGSTFIRQLWLEVVVRDAAGAVLYETGTLDDNGDLRDHFSALDPYGDDDLITFGSGFVDAHGDPEIFTWRAQEHFSRSLAPLHSRTATLFVPTSAETVGPLTVEARLRFRSHPPFLLRALGLDELVDRIEIHDLASASGRVPVVAP